MNILESEKRLKKMPFDVPDGYFTDLQQKVMKSAGSTAASHVPGGARHYPGITMRLTTAAAMLAAVVTGGLAVIGQHRDSDMEKERMIDASFFYTELMPADADLLYDTDSYGYIADSDLSDEDIIDYLIYSGTPVELLNESDYE